ncbi:carboxylate-amine ligase [Haloactinomyces albus]|uniref:Putative glutamate--cysteine ligase 2 n=1 Tax=Haloactinomyces albus TaxID=1352928 RepID=A0AAE3ZHP9_9ACTN|nr:glutamate--cysteine ligase [Haloactinomyces albus]MDR7304260.1 carboxylate-amine ligase [Haloactinomyces albus]
MSRPDAGHRTENGQHTILTLGVEEEFLLLDSESLQPTGEGGAVSRIRRRQEEGEVQFELTPSQIETSSSVCHDLEELRRKLAYLRTDLAAAAVQRGRRLAAIAAPPTGQAGPPPVTDTPRYRRMYESYGALVEDQGVCACHVHVGTLDLESALLVSNHLRPWLPALLLVTTNSPFFRNADTGYASWRTALWSRLPTACPPPYFTSVEHYRALVDILQDSGMVLDLGMLYWYVRPSEHMPTLEVRIADAAATADEAVLLAGLVRALTVIALRDIARGRAAEPIDEQMLQASCWRAARDGLEGSSLDVLTGQVIPSWELLDGLVRHVRPGLEELGDLHLITRLLRILRARGSGASRQRAVFRRHRDIDEVVEHVLTETMRDTTAKRAKPST